MNAKFNWDALGIAASVACAIHCALLPLFLTSLPLFGVNIINNKSFETIMIALSFFIGTYSLYHGLQRHHHRPLPLYIFTIGFACLLIKEFSGNYETLLLAFAVALIVSAHFVNYRFCRLADQCRTGDCNH